MNSQKNLFDSYKLGPFTLKNRILMAPLTRMRCDKTTSIPNDLLVEYYKQRASFGMIITESSPINQRGDTYPGSPGIYNNEQVAGWKKVVDAVHAEGGLMCLQIYHCGRAMAEGILPQNINCWGPSEIQVRDFDVINKAYFLKPHAMTTSEIQQVIFYFRQGAENAKKAGFDTIMLHAGNGFIVDQFLKDQTNQRNDEYGGSIENRCRFALEIIDELIAVFGKERTGIRISPVDWFNDMFDSDPLPLFTYLVKKLDEKGIEFIEFKETGTPQTWNSPIKIPDCCAVLRPFFSKTIIKNESLDKEKSHSKINEGSCDLVSFGTLAIANPDLPERFKNNFQLAKANPEYFFSGGAKGYSDYPVYDQSENN